MNEYLSDLQYLHDKIKNNPFRTGEYKQYSFYEKEYISDLEEFANTFYHFTKSIQTSSEAKASESNRMISQIANQQIFVHDFVAAIRRYENALYKGNFPVVFKQEELIEQYISTIHCFLDTELILKYPYKEKGEIHWMKWNKETQNYERK
jgi:hypothetical protein